MGNMADEMRARMEADGGAGLPGGGEGAPAPGNAESPPTPASPPAGESNADTGAGSGTPDTIPYARFKEVNDRLGSLRPVEELFQYGYDADSLRRLAEFETQYLQDPYGTLATLAENLDLPQETVEAIKAKQAELAGGDGRAEGVPPAGETKPPELPPEVKARLDYVDQLREREQNAAREAQLQAVVEAWDRLDKADEVETPERIKLMAIATVAGSGQQFRTFDEMAIAAREVINDFRGQTLGSAVRTGRGGGAPPALPAGGAPASGPVKFKDIREASRAAEAAISRGELPPVGNLEGA